MEQLRTGDYILIIFGLWLAILSFFYLKLIKSWKRINRGAGDLNLEKILQDIFAKQDLTSKEIAQNTLAILQQKKQQVGNFQKYALIRFNPFEDTGGDQSFVVALLDGQDSGVVISSMHTRAGTRVYAKEVVGAKPAAAHQFSKEERQAVEKARLR